MGFPLRTEIGRGRKPRSKLLKSRARDNFLMLWRARMGALVGTLMAEPTEIDWAEQIAYLRELARIVRDEDLSRIDIESDGMTWTLKAASTMTAPISQVGGVAALTATAPALPAQAQAKAKAELTPLPSPMVGVFYHAPSPGEPNFLEIGDRVERGQTIGLIEAMKVFNEITAEASGFVVEIPVGNGQLVETGMPLVLLKS